MTALDETRTATGEVAAADRTMVTVVMMAPWQLGEALSEMAFPLNFDGFSKIVWRPMMRNRAAAAS
jgi:hypothetical protein